MTKIRALIYFRDGSTSYGVSPSRAAELLSEKLGSDYDFVVPSSDSDDELSNLLSECDAVIGTSATLDEKIARLATQSPKVGLIQCIGAGIERFPLQYLQNSKKDLVLADASGASAVAVAEHAFSLMICLAKRITHNDSQIKSGVWEKETNSELYGKTLLILGLGSIGKELAKRSLGFGMKVIGLRKHPSKIPDLPDCKIVGMDGLDEALEEADFVAITLPLTNDTDGMIGEAQFRHMKRTAFLINAARGRIVKEAALKRSLSEGRIAGAGIDTWYAYPPDKETPSKEGIHLLPNVAATSHVASATDESVQRTFELVAENLSRYANNLSIMNAVDRQLGY